MDEMDGNGMGQICEARRWAKFDLSQGCGRCLPQVLNSKLQGREQKLTASVHLSVVPKSSGVGRAERHERHLVAAIRLSDEIQD